MADSCATCVSFKLGSVTLGPNTFQGLCRRSPPIAYVRGATSPVWPPVNSDHWCAEFSTGEAPIIVTEGGISQVVDGATLYTKVLNPDGTVTTTTTALPPRIVNVAGVAIDGASFQWMAVANDGRIWTNLADTGWALVAGPV